MSNHTGLKSILGLEFYKKQKDWKFERQKSTFDFNRDPENPLHRRQRQGSEKPSCFIRSFTSVDKEEYRGKITRKQSLDSSRNSSYYSNSSKTDHRNRRSFNSSVSSNKNNIHVSQKYYGQSTSPYKSSISNNDRFNNSGIGTRIGYPRNNFVAPNKLDLNKTYELKKYFDFDICKDETMICHDNIDGQIDTNMVDMYNMESIELNTTFDKESKESVVLDILSGSMQATKTEPYIEDLVSEEQFFIGASKKFHSSAVDLPTCESDILVCGFKDVDQKAVTTFTRPVYSVPAEEELERMQKMSYQELMREILLEHVHMQQHLEKKKSQMEAMVDKIEFGTTEDTEMHQNFSCGNVERAEVLRIRKNNNYRFITGSTASSGDSNERFCRYTCIPLVWNL